MELQIKKQNLPISEIVFDTQTEQPVECDILLPDYCPDIRRILSCELSCLTRETSAQQQRLTISGELHLNILYVSDSGQLRGIEQKLPFSRHLESKTVFQDPMIEVHCKEDYLNCRAVSSRRLEIRGAVTLKVRAVNCSTVELLEDVGDSNIQLKKTSMELNSCVSSGESAFSIREELELGNRPPIAQILSSRVQAQLTDHKLISGKIVSKGELSLQLLYLPLSSDENEAPQTLDYTLPISQIVSIAGVREDSEVCLSYEVSGWELQPKADLDGEMKVLSMEVQLRAFAAVHQRQQVTLVQDAYSTAAALALEEKQLSTLNFRGCVRENHRIRESLSVGKGVQSILDSWVKVKDVQCHQEEDGLRLHAAVALSALVIDGEGEYQLLEESLQAEHSIPLSTGEKGLLFDLQLRPVSVEAVLNSSGQPELRGQLLLSGCLYSMERKTALAGLTLDETVPPPQKGDCALCIYYADSQESIWDIGKKYNSSVGGILEENGLDHDILPQRTMLLIPIC